MGFGINFGTQFGVPSITLVYQISKFVLRTPNYVPKFAPNLMCQYIHCNLCHLILTNITCMYTATHCHVLHMRFCVNFNIQFEQYNCLETKYFLPKIQIPNMARLI